MYNTYTMNQSVIFFFFNRPTVYKRVYKKGFFKYSFPLNICEKINKQ